jgi:predicted transcriptional regulator
MEASRQFSFRLPDDLVQRVEACAQTIRANGLEVTRADVVRLLLNHALDATKCRLNLLLRPSASRKPQQRKR